MPYYMFANNIPSYLKWMLDIYAVHRLRSHILPSQTIA